MYEYKEKHVAPRTVDFITRTAQGRRVVRVYLDLPTPRLTAFNELSSSERHPALLWLTEILTLVERAKEICNLKGSSNED